MAEKELLKVFNDSKVDWTKSTILLDVGTSLGESTDIVPNDFLKFAAEDLETNDLRGHINAVTNAKRAIDCQIDNFIASLGYDYKKDSSQINQYINKKIIKKNSTQKLAFIQAMEVAPVNLISKVRTLRNKVEHDYFCPSKKDAHDAVELAELFISCIRDKMTMIWSDFDIRDPLKKSYSDALHFNYMPWDDFSFDIRYKNDEIKINPNSNIYLYLIKLMLALRAKHKAVDALADLLEAVGSSFPRKYLKVKIIEPLTD